MLCGKRFANEKVAIIQRIVTPRPSSLLHGFPLASTLLTFLLKGSRFWMAIHPMIMISGVDVEHAGHPVVTAWAGDGLGEGKKEEEEEEDQVKWLQLC